MEVLKFIAFSYALMVVTWVFYLAVMALIPHRHNLRPVAKVHAYALLAVGLVLDAILNVVVASVMFLEPPSIKRLLLTARISHHVTRDHGWRTTLARWLCEHLLDQFDPNGKHCG